MIKISKTIPSVFTLGNLLCGVFSLSFIMHDHFYIASLLILLGGLFDLLDGKLARRLNASGKIGVELDSLADIVTFGVAPAFLSHYLSGPSVWATIGFILFPTMGALRLARFNASPTVGYYLGVPITLAGTITAILGLFGYAHPFISIILSILMVSTMRVPKI